MKTVNNKQLAFQECVIEGTNVYLSNNNEEAVEVMKSLGEDKKGGFLTLPLAKNKMTTYIRTYKNKKNSVIVGVFNHIPENMTDGAFGWIAILNLGPVEKEKEMREYANKVIPEIIREVGMKIDEITDFKKPSELVAK